MYFWVGVELARADASSKENHGLQNEKKGRSAFYRHPDQFFYNIFFLFNYFDVLYLRFALYIVFLKNPRKPNTYL